MLDESHEYVRGIIQLGPAVTLTPNSFNRCRLPAAKYEVRGGPGPRCRPS
jgi:hypothetical protein